MIRQFFRVPIVFPVFLALALSGCASGPGTEARVDDAPAPAERVGLASLRLPSPAGSEEKTYLGIPEAPTFKLGEIDAEFLLIEVFDMYCPYCQREAPNVNRLYAMIQERPDLRDRLKIIGIGWGNSAYEVNLFKRRYAIPFPLFPDNDEAVGREIELKGTPTFTLVRNRGDGTMDILYNDFAHLDDVGAFLSKLLAAAGIE